LYVTASTDFIPLLIYQSLYLRAFLGC
jgi:hypothetical protein